MRIGDFMRAGAPAGGRNRTVYLWWVIWIVWLPLFIPNLVAFVQAGPAPLQLVAGLAGAALFFSLYLWTTWRSARYLASPSPPVRPTGTALWAPVAVMVALCVILTLTGRAEVWGSLFIYASACAAGWLPLRPAAYVILGMALFTIIGLGLHGPISAAVSPVTFIVVPGFVVIALVQSVTTGQQLRAAREEVASLAAVTEERLRIARDLHDLLGHNLSLIALKSELAGRLVSTAPERAAAEIGDIESVARKALQEVREAVAGYRQPTLAGELAAAREILAAAGIAYRYQGDERASRSLPSAVDAALAWAVREGITNVIRHSHARVCTLSMHQRNGEAWIELVDDGTKLRETPSAPFEPATGNGLRGLAERVRALSGRCEYGPRTNGGFRLYVCVPVERAGQTEPPPGGQSAAGTPTSVEATAAGRADADADADEFMEERP